MPALRSEIMKGHVINNIILDLAKILASSLIPGRSFLFLYVKFKNEDRVSIIPNEVPVNSVVDFK